MYKRQPKEDAYGEETESIACILKFPPLRFSAFKPLNDFNASSDTEEYASPEEAMTLKLSPIVVKFSNPSNDFKAFNPPLNAFISKLRPIYFRLFNPSKDSMPEEEPFRCV